MNWTEQGLVPVPEVLKNGTNTQSGEEDVWESYHREQMHISGQLTGSE